MKKLSLILMVLALVSCGRKKPSVETKSESPVLAACTQEQSDTYYEALGACIVEELQDSSNLEGHKACVAGLEKYISDNKEISCMALEGEKLDALKKASGEKTEVERKVNKDSLDAALKKAQKALEDAEKSEKVEQCEAKVIEDYNKSIEGCEVETVKKAEKKEEVVKACIDSIEVFAKENEKVNCSLDEESKEILNADSLNKLAQELADLLEPENT